MAKDTLIQVRFYEDSNFGKSDRRFYEDRLKSGRVTTAGGLVLDLAVVADGIGGENAGERAAEMTIEEVFDCVRTSEEKDIPLILENAIEMANAKVYLEAQRERHKQDMGSTAVVAAVHEGRLYIANVGDSRVYLVRGGQLQQLTWDHTLGNELVREGTLTRAEADVNLRRDELMRSIGYEPQVMVDLGLYTDQNFNELQAREQQGLPLKQGDRVLLCTDGLIKARRNGKGHFVEPQEIIEILEEAPGSESARQLVDKALERKTDDNVSVIVMEVPARLPVHFPKPARAVFITMLFVGLVGLAFLAPSLRRPPSAPTLPPIEISQDQAYISEIESTELEFIPSGDESRLAAGGEYIDFVPGAVLKTGPAEKGYVLIGLPGRAELFLASNSEIQLVSSDRTGVVLQLQAGRAIINLQDDFPADRRLTVYSPSWVRTWVSSSTMCLWYEPQGDVFTMDCVADRCGYDDSREKLIEAGSHVQFSGLELSSVGVGLQPEMCQFVPGLVPSSTPTITPSTTATQKRISQSKSLIQWTSTPKEKEPPSIPTRAPTSTPRPTFTPIPPPTNTSLPTVTPPPTFTNTPVPPPTDTNTPVPPTDTNTPVPTPTDLPTNTPVPTPTDIPTATPIPTETPLGGGSQIDNTQTPPVGGSQFQATPTLSTPPTPPTP